MDNDKHRMTTWKLYIHAHDNLLFERESIDGLSHRGTLNILQVGDQLLFGDGESATRHTIFKMIHQKRYDIIDDTNICNCSSTVTFELNIINILMDRRIPASGAKKSTYFFFVADGSTSQNEVLHLETNVLSFIKDPSKWAPPVMVEENQPPSWLTKAERIVFSSKISTWSRPGANPVQSHHEKST